MTLLADRRTALFTGIFTAIIAGFLAPRGLEFTVYALISSSVAVYGIGRYRSRQTVTIAGGLCRSFERSAGRRDHRIYAAAIYSEHGPSCYRLRPGERDDNRGIDRHVPAACETRFGF